MSAMTRFERVLTGGRRPAAQWHRRSELALGGIAIAAFFAVAATTDWNLLNAATLKAVMQYLAVPILLGLSQMVVLAVGQMNLSVGVLTGLCAMVSAWLMMDIGLAAWLAVPAAVVLGGVVGVINGLLVVATRINGFIVTLATMTIISGFRYGVHGTSTYQGYAPDLVSLGRSSILGLPTVFFAALAASAAVAWFFARAVLGRRLLATGGNPLAARLSGISNDRSVVVGHALSGLLAGLAAVLVLALSGSVNASIGDDLLLPSFAAPIIGGVALAGGGVKVVGTLLAAFIVRLVDVAQAQYNISPRWVDLVVGAVVLGTVLLSQRPESRRTS